MKDMRRTLSSKRFWTDFHPLPIVSAGMESRRMLNCFPMEGLPGNNVILVLRTLIQFQTDAEPIAGFPLVVTEWSIPMKFAIRDHSTL